MPILKQLRIRLLQQIPNLNFRVATAILVSVRDEHERLADGVSASNLL
jgi:hypothetical protein